MRLLTFDFETELMGEGALVPSPVALAIFDTESQDQLVFVGMDDMAAGIEYMLGEEGVICVAHNLSFDAGVIIRHFPQFAKQVYASIKSGKFTCTLIREKLVNLCTSGEVDNLNGQRISYSLAACVDRNLGFDMGDKEDEDSWRMHFIELKDIPYELWPEDAKEYILLDVLTLPDLYNDQSRRNQEVLDARGYSCLVEESFRCLCSLSLSLMADRGFSVDKVEKERIEAYLAEELKPERMRLITQAGILIPAVPEMPYKNGARNKDGTPKMKKAKKESISNKTLREYVMLMYEDMPDEIELRYTDPTDRNPEGQLQVDREWLDEFDHLDPVIKEYSHRQSLQKYVTTELPRMCRADGTSADTVHPSFDVLKKTGRTSSYASKIFPSFNCQNVYAKVRNCFKARKGHWMFSIDYSQMELGTFAQTCLNLLGYSVMAEIINEGIGPHEYLGAQMAYKFEPMFAEYCDQKCNSSSPTKRQIYEVFYDLKNSKEDRWAKYASEDVNGEIQYTSLYKHFRTYAKPTGLGYPGGLGARTFVKYSKSTYGIIITQSQAEDFKEVWGETFPEGPEYLKYINDHNVDPYHRKTDKKTGAVRDAYWYESPFGLVRPNADYCAVANGQALQTPSACGALTAVNEIMEKCEIGEFAGKVFPQGFIHDEIVGEVYADPETAGPLLNALADIMVRCMRIVTPDVAAGAEPAMMLVWDKRAEPVFNDKGQLIPWEPEEKAS